MASPNPTKLLFSMDPLGPGDVPSPKTSRVTPCFRSLRDLPSCIKVLYPQLSIFTKPGEIILLEASIVSFAMKFCFLPT